MTHIRIITMTDKDKKANFKRLATSRTNDVLDRLRVLGNCSNRRAYSYSDEEVDRIFKAIDEQVKIVKAKFKQPRKGFKL
jgi:hypothetical protein